MYIARVIIGLFMGNEIYGEYFIALMGGAFLLSCFWAYICAKIASNKAKDEGIWGFVGFLLGIFAFALVVAANDKKDEMIRKAMLNHTVDAWKCDKCGEENSLKEEMCARCGKIRPYGVNVNPVVKAGAGQWKCVCGRINNDYVGTCGCGKKRPRR